MKNELVNFEGVYINPKDVFMCIAKDSCITVYYCRGGENDYLRHTYYIASVYTKLVELVENNGLINHYSTFAFTHQDEKIVVYINNKIKITYIDKNNTRVCLGNGSIVNFGNFMSSSTIQMIVMHLIMHMSKK